MNTKFLMTSSAIVLGLAGIVLSFMPDAISAELFPNDNSFNTIVLQIIGALYLGFAMLNWMSKGSIIGGIYNRPIATANFIHFFVAGLALVKFAFSNSNSSVIFIITAVIYSVFAVLFVLIMLTHPRV